MKKLLLIDDDSAIHLIASAALQGAGAFQIGFASTGRKGIERAKATRPDLILLDVLLPDIRGEEVLEHLRREKSLRETPVIFLTAKGGDPGFDYKELGAQGLITKPFDPDHLADEIRQVLGLDPGEPGRGGVGNGNGEGSSAAGSKPALPFGGSVDLLRRSFVERGCKEVEHLINSLGPRFDVDAARRIAHLWVGRGGTLGHPEVSVVARRLELRLAGGWGPQKRWRAQSELRDVKEAFEAAWKLEERTREEAPKEKTAEFELLVLNLDATDSDIGVAGLEVAAPLLPSPADTATAAAAGAGAGAESAAGPAAQEVVPLAIAELPKEFRDALAGRTAVLLGFDQCDREAMREAFSAVDVTIRTSRLGLHIDRRDELADVDVAVINVDSKQAEMAWEQVDTLAQAEVPCLAVGPARQLLSGAGHAGSCEFLLAPWCAEEVLLRCYQLVAAAAAAGLVGAQEETVAVNSNIVLADDDPTITALVEMTLREVGLTCHIAAGGKDALELIQRLRPGAVVLDVNMPQMDGFEVLAAVRNDPATRSIPVVMLTALRQEADVIRGFGLGADDYVVKPFNPMELSARLERLIRPSR